MVDLADSIRKHCPTVDPGLIAMHCRRMPEAYFERYSAADIARHVRLLAGLTSERLVAVEVRPLATHTYEIIVAGVDMTGVLACITTALAAGGLSLQDVQLATYLQEEAAEAGVSEPTYFVDVLRVSGHLQGRTPQEAGKVLEQRLGEAFRHLAAGHLEAAQATASDSWTRHPGSADTSGIRSGKTSVPPLGEPLSGVLLGNDFRLTEKLATGGTAHVYLATQVSLGRMVAVKVAYHDASSDPTAMARFVREAKVLGSFSCPYIVQVLATGSVPVVGNRTMYWLAMEYLAGGDVAQWLRQHGRPPMELAVRWFRQALEGLHYAHRQGILHRDLKPHNLLLTDDGQLKISDFGLLKLARQTGPQHTAHGAILGTPYYMSPEQALGETLDERSDLYSLGATFLHIFSGRLPYEQKNYTAVLMEIAQRDPPRLTALMPDAPAPLTVILARLMARRSEERYQDVRVVLEDLASYERRGLLTVADSGSFVIRPQKSALNGAVPTVEQPPPQQ